MTAGAPHDRWFEQRFGQAPYRDAFQIKAELFYRETPFQRVAIVDSVGFGRMLVNDGLVMIADADEFIYHEMMVHVAMCCHARPERILVIGGGDGGIVREVLKHPSVVRCDVVEIDQVVIDACKEFFPSCARSLDDARVQLHVEDGARFVRETSESFDVIFVDSTDPIGPARVLFEQIFYENVRARLREGGIVVAQAESAYVTRAEHLTLLRLLSSLFEIVVPYQYTNLTYAPGPWSFAFASTHRHPLRDLDSRRIAAGRIPCRHYNESMHRAAFAQPEWMITENLQESPEETA